MDDRVLAVAESVLRDVVGAAFVVGLIGGFVLALALSVGLDLGGGVYRRARVWVSSRRNGGGSAVT